MPTDTINEEFRVLGTINTDNHLQLKQKKVVFKGYDHKEVEEYISILKKEMQMTEKAYNEKLEECFASCEMYLRERDKFMQIIKDTEKKANQYKADAIEACEKNKIYMVQINRENQKLKEIVNSFKKQIDDTQQVNKFLEKIEQLNQDNQELKSAVKQLITANNQILSEIKIINTKIKQS